MKDSIAYDRSSVGSIGERDCLLVPRVWRAKQLKDVLGIESVLDVLELHVLLHPKGFRYSSSEKRYCIPRCKFNIRAHNMVEKKGLTEILALNLTKRIVLKTETSELIHPLVQIR